jgi:hypothetical protein
VHDRPFVVKKGTAKICGCASGGMPLPLVGDLNEKNSPSRLVRISMRPAPPTRKLHCRGSSRPGLTHRRRHRGGAAVRSKSRVTVTFLSLWPRIVEFMGKSRCHCAKLDELLALVCNHPGNLSVKGSPGTSCANNQKNAKQHKSIAFRLKVATSSYQARWRARRLASFSRYRNALGHQAKGCCKSASIF